MELQKLNVKFFVEQPDNVALTDFIEVFHSWIQQQMIKGHLLIDVQDYSHVQRSGISLVAHEGNFSMDETTGQLGLVYYRKQPVADPLKAAFEVWEPPAVFSNRNPNSRASSFTPTSFWCSAMIVFLRPTPPKRASNSSP